MSVVDDFIIWYSGVQSAVQEALGGPLKDGLLQEVKKKAQENVYNAYPGGYRRGQIGSEQNMAVDVNGYELHVRNITVQQGGKAYQTETGFVEEGAPEFRQPFPRPFMDEALQDYAYGEGPEDLANYLRSHGFIVT
ncbi:MAG: hypothetical protein IKF99_20300 [Oscillospiraceae bacterium]|nr:hypothetical protein [Oscillospiraceae bacterium]